MGGPPHLIRDGGRLIKRFVGADARSTLFRDFAAGSAY
jgi:hypothetical protein